MKTLLRSNFIAALVGVVLALYAQVSAAPFAWPDLAGAAASQYVPGEVLVKFKPAAVAQERAASVASLGHTVLAQLEQPGWVHVKLGAGQTMEAALAAYRNDPNVEYAQPNYIYHASLVPNDPQYGQLWAFKNTGQTIINANFSPFSGTPGDDIHIEPAWGQITDCSTVIVAVVDTGVNYNQEDLAANMWNGGLSFPNHGNDFVDNDNDPMDLNGHGTHVAGIIGAAGNNAKGTTGVCWTASIMAVRVLDASGSGSDATIIPGINFAITNGAKVINMSLGHGGAFSQVFSDAITSAQNSGVVVVVSAGNATSNNDATPHYPCNFTQPNLICVAALDPNFALASFSNFGATSVDVGAPGTNILSTFAGTTATITDNFGRPGALNWTTSGGGWADGTLGVSGNNFIAGSAFDALLNPSMYPSGAYLNNQDGRVYKTFPLTGNVATLDFFAQVDISTGDALNVSYKAAGGDPFAGGGTQLISGPGTTGGIAELTFDISPCIGATCSVGFQLTSDGATTNKGAGIVLFSIQTLTLTTNTYQIDTGTSMATPMVAGLAAMLRAFNPQFTYVDTVNTIKNAGKPVAALAGKTTTGKAVDVMSSLAYINPPTGLSAAVQ